MNCPHCQAAAAVSFLTFCPVCGKRLSAAPGFELTWAQMAEDTLKKHSTFANFQQAWNWHLQNIKSHPEQIIEAVEFLERYPGFSSQLEEIDFDSQEFSHVWGLMDNAHRLLVYGALQGDGPSLYRLAIHNANLHPDLRALLHRKEGENTQLAPLARALCGQRDKARSALRDLLGCPAGYGLVLADPDSQKLFANLDAALPERMAALAAARQNQDVKAYLEHLYRPLPGAQNPYEHLENLSFLLEGFLSSHEEEWVNRTMEYLEADECLQGIHLALMTIKSAFPSLKSSAGYLLDKQYEKAYLRPFEEIEATSRIWHG